MCTRGARSEYGSHEPVWLAAHGMHARQKVDPSPAASDTLVGGWVQPVMLGDARVAAEMAERLLAEGIYVIGFSYPVVPQGKARIRVQMSAVHTTADIEHAVASFVKVARDMGVLPGPA